MMWKLPGGGAPEVIVFLHTTREPLQEVGVEMSAIACHDEPEPHDDAESDGIGELFDALDMAVSEEVVEQYSSEVIETPGSASGHQALPDVEEPTETTDAARSSSVTVDGIVLTTGSSLGVLKAACTHLSLRTSGSKTRLFERIKGYLEKQQLSLYQDLASAAAEQRKPNMQSLPRPPSREEQLLHEITHVPYAPWCPHCVLCVLFLIEANLYRKRQEMFQAFLSTSAILGIRVIAACQLIQKIKKTICVV